MLNRLIYCSHLKPGLSEKVVYDIVKEAKTNNEKNGITGILVFGANIFFQALEGDRDKLSVLLKKLYNDKRHENVELLDFTEITEKEFESWGMELKTLSQEADEFLLKNNISQYNPYQFNSFQAYGFALAAKQWRLKRIDNN